MSSFVWGLVVGCLIAQVGDILRTWRAARARVNAARKRAGQPPETRWWRL